MSVYVEGIWGGGGDMAQEVRYGWYGSGGKSCHLAVGGLPVRSHPGRVEVSLSNTPNPQLFLTSWLVPCIATNRRWCVNVCVNGWMRGINCKALWIKALYKCSPFPFTISRISDWLPCKAPTRTKVGLGFFIRDTSTHPGQNWTAENCSYCLRHCHLSL